MCLYQNFYHFFNSELFQWAWSIIQTDTLICLIGALKHFVCQLDNLILLDSGSALHSLLTLPRSTAHTNYVCLNPGNQYHWHEDTHPAHCEVENNKATFEHHVTAGVLDTGLIETFAIFRPFPLCFKGKWRSSHQPVDNVTVATPIFYIWSLCMMLFPLDLVELTILKT